MSFTDSIQNPFSFPSVNKANLTNPLSSCSIFPHLHQCIHLSAYTVVFVYLQVWLPWAGCWCFECTGSSHISGLPVPSAAWDPEQGQQILAQRIHRWVCFPRMRQTDSGASPGCDALPACWFHSQSLENTICEKTIQVGIIKSIKKWTLPAESTIH